jgi:hypothetical protein
LEINDIDGGWCLVQCFYITLNSHVYNNYHWLRRHDGYRFPIPLNMICNMYIRKVWRYIRGDQKLKDKRTKGQTVIYKTLHRQLRVYNEFEIHTPLFICFIASNFHYILTKSFQLLYTVKVTSVASVYYMYHNTSHFIN